MELGRRRTLRAVGVVAGVAVAGCSETGPGRTSTAIYVTNETDAELFVTLRVYDLPDEDGSEANDDDSEESDDAEAGEQLLARRTELASGENTTVGGDDLPDGRMRVRIAVRDGPEESTDWNRVDELSTLDVRVNDRTVTFLELD